MINIIIFIFIFKNNVFLKLTFTNIFTFYRNNFMLKNFINQVKNEIQQSSSKSNQIEAKIPSQEKIFSSNKVFLFKKNESMWNSSKIASIQYQSNFLSENEIQILTDWLEKSSDFNWVNLEHSKRRLIKLGGDVTSEGLINITKLPLIFDKLANQLFTQQISIKPANHFLINEYSAGIGIMPHFDGPLYHSHVVVLSLFSSCILKFYQNLEDSLISKSIAEILVESNSLYTFEKDAYDKYLHAINDVKFDEICCLFELDDEGKVIEVKNSSVDNFKATMLWKSIKNKKVEDIQKVIEIVSVENNSFYNYTLFLKRERRTSFTIRYVPEFIPK